MVIAYSSNAHCLANLSTSRFSTIFECALTFFDGYIMSKGCDGVCDEGNEKFIKVVILEKRVPLCDLVRSIHC